MPTPPLALLWKSYQALVMADDAPEVQVTECRRAFYAGAAGLMQVLKHIGDDDAIDEDAGSHLLELIEQELDHFSRAVAEGRA